MIKRLLLIFVLFVIFVLTAHSQVPSADNRLRDMVGKTGEALVTIPYTDRKTIDIITRNVSIISVRNKTIEISLSGLTVEWFIQQKFSYTIREKPELKGIVTASSVSEVFAWDKYPTYTQYDSIMQSYATLYPALCHLDTIGTSIRGKLVLALKISDNAGVDEAEPEVFYSSTMHGDEVGGFILMLRLIDLMLKNYNTNPRIKELVDNLEIWINPCANPDGTYNNVNTIANAIRYNAHGYDLNRNFPDILETDNIIRQKETLDMMAFMRKHHFILSANFHAGAELVNYPWDKWLDKLHPDNDWFYDISRTYADTAHQYSDSGYLYDLDDGITRGSVWYVVLGGRQDFMTHELHGREVTIELDYDHVTQTSYLPVLWENNWRSLIGYLENALYGIHGLVIDAYTSAPVPAKVFIAGHDADSSQVYADTLTGNFVRMLSPGIWPVTFTASGYRDTTINVSVSARQKTDLVVLMDPGTTPPDTTTTEKKPAIYPNPAKDEINAILPEEVAGNVNVQIFSQLGTLITDYDAIVVKDIPLIIDISRFSPGIYSAVFKNSRKKTTSMGRFIVIK